MKGEPKWDIYLTLKIPLSGKLKLCGKMSKRLIKQLLTKLRIEL